MMNYIDIIPYVNNDMFLAKVVMSDYNSGNPLVIRITARKNDGTYQRKVVNYPDETSKYDGVIYVPFFGMTKSVIAQIVGVRINGVEVRVDSTEVDPNTKARYDDSISRLSWYQNMNNIKLDFQVVGTDNPRTLRIVDESEWGALTERPAIIEITPPGKTEPVVSWLGKNQVNLFTTKSLGFNCDDPDNTYLYLPDGVYDITIKGSPSSYKFNRKYLKTDIVRLNLDKVWARAGILCDHVDEDLMEKIKQAEFVISAAESNMRLGNIEDARSLLEKAQRLIEIINNCNNCKCNV